MADALDTLRQALADRYAIERELGQGGMATVYLADDVRHHRKVALKVLRPEIAVTVGAGRFAREIEVAARLQHPNILPLLDSGEAAGFFFYVMPFVEGESLRERLERSGPLAIPDAVRILVEVADALSHAHARGVVHRDIKPDNILVAGRHALVADFGVAKAVTEATGQAILTSRGVALGTPAYMAPEQALADPQADHRVDLYALGLVGYELLTGRRPFAATTAQEMLAAHVTAVPDPVERHRTAVSPALAAVVMKCLAKQPADRWQTADELLAHLEPLATPSGGTTPVQTPPLPASRRLPRWAIWGVVTMAAVAVVALTAVRLLRPTPLAVTASDLTQVTSEPGVEFQPAISPDGNEVAYVAGPLSAPHLYVRSTVNVAGGGAVRLSDSASLSERFPAWTPDGQAVRIWACGRAGCSWRLVAKLGGSAQQLPLPRGVGSNAAWSRDGRRFVFVRRDTLFLGLADSAGVRALAGGAGKLHSFAFSPDGRRLASVAGNAQWLQGPNPDVSAIRVGDAYGGGMRTVAVADHLNVSPVWLDDSHLLYVSDRDGERAVYVLAVGRGGARGAPLAVPGIADPHSIAFSPVSRKLAFSKLTFRQNVRTYPLGPAAPLSLRAGQPVTSGSQVIETHGVSPDGRWLVYSSTLRGRYDLFKMPVRGGQPVLLTGSSTGGFEPVWSPDGREIVYTGVVNDTGLQVMAVSAEGGVPVALTHGPGRFTAPDWSPDGLHVVMQNVAEGRYHAWTVSRDGVGGRWHEAVPLTDVTCGDPNWAPDGVTLACKGPAGLRLVSARTGQVLRDSLSARAHLASIATPGRFSADGRTLYVAAVRADGARGIWAIPASGGPARLVIASDDPSLEGDWFTVRGDRLYVTVAETESDIWVATLHW